MRVFHGLSAVFDDPNLVSCAGLAPVLRLAERAGFQELVGEHVLVHRQGGVNAYLKVPALVAGMVAGADSIDDSFSITARQDPAIRRAIAGIDDDAWTAIKYTNAIFDEHQQRWISDAEVAEWAKTRLALLRR